MPLMEWKPSYSVGVEKFDADHRRLMELLNQLNDAMLARQGKLVIGSVLKELLEYTERHFSAEERAMLRCGYEGLDQHVKQHRALTERVRLLVSEYELGDTLISVEVLSFLRDWLDGHILGTDQGYAQCLKSKLP